MKSKEIISTTQSRALGIPRESVRHVLKFDLNLYPYKIQIKQKLTQADIDKRVTMCEWFCDTIEDNPDFLDHLVLRRSILSAVRTFQQQE